MGFLKKLLSSMPGADDHGVETPAAAEPRDESDREHGEAGGTHESPAEKKA